MPAGVDLRVPARWLGDTEQPIDLREQDGQGATLAQHLEERGWMPFRQGLAQFLPDPLRHQGVHFPGLHHLPHQCHGLRGHTETQFPVAGRKTGHPENPDRVFRKGG